MKAFWTVLAVLLLLLAIGGLNSLSKASDTATRVGDVIIIALLLFSSWRSWQAARQR